MNTQVDKPFVVSFTSLGAGLFTMAISMLQMSGFITPKGADALSNMGTFLGGVAIVIFSSYFYHAHHAEVTKAKLANPTPVTPAVTQ